MPRISRQEWARHPRFPEQTLLLESHDAFRLWLDAFTRRLDYLSDETAEASRKRRRWLARMRDDFAFWLTGMRGHERYEERTLYPRLAARYGVSFSDLERHHRTLESHKRGVLGALAAALETPTGAAVPLGGARAAVLAFDVALAGHLAAEEELVIPMLLELSPEEFRALAPRRARSRA